VANYNKVILIGNLTRDPQLRYTPSQMAVCEFGLAINRRRRNSAGEQQDETCFVDITAWSKQAETISKYLAKGRQILVEGRLTFDRWETPEGQKRSKLRVTLENFQFLDSNRGGGGGGGGPSQQGPKPMGGEAGGGSGGGGGGDYQYNQDLEDDTIPF
jgi:single-strand DNA-binding protein